MAILLSALLALLPLTLAPGLLYYYDITPKIVVLLSHHNAEVTPITILKM